MAKQHFYTRVPSRISMFLKADSFDTFACSDGIKREYLEKDMLPILEQKPTLEETGLIRNGKLPPIYLSYALKDGTYVQSCISYLPLDYTKERTSYMVHSLIFDEENQDSVLNHTDNQVINKDLFMHNLDAFDITSPQAKPNNKYEELPYVSKPFPNDKHFDELFDHLDVITLKKFLFSLLCVLTNKAKAIYVLLPKEFNDDDNLVFLNRILQIFPYHLRKHLSFITRVSDTVRYSGFKVKILNDNIGPIPTSKGVYIDFRENNVVGIKDVDLKNYGHLAEFMYSLLKDESIRINFLENTHSEVSLIPNLGNLNFKEFDDLINIFKMGSNFYNEFVTIPNDEKMLDFFTIYEKYREAMSIEYRIHFITCLNRYPNNYQAIPKNIFNKLSKIYNTEIYATKHLIMNVCLELIHTELMRPMLFNFLKNNFSKEDADTKNIIIQNLTGVFYGGFLQTQIIALFDEYFDEESVENRLTILEKLLLAIRTKEIQQPLFEFVSKHYEGFNKKEKILFFQASAEHLAEGDTLAEKLLNLCDQVVESEEEEIKEIYTKKLIKVLNTEFKNKERLLLPLIATSDGYTFRCTAECIYNRWKTKKITSSFVMLASSIGDFKQRINKIIDIWAYAPIDIDDKLAKAITKACINGFNDKPVAAGLIDILETKKLVNSKIISNIFRDNFNNEVLDPLIDKSLLLVFSSTEVDQVELIMDYIKIIDSIKDTDNYNVLNNYLLLKNNILNDDFANAVINVDKLSTTTPVVKTRIAKYLKLDLLSSNRISYNTDEGNDFNKLEILAGIMINYLNTLEFHFDLVYSDLNDRFQELHRGEKDGAWIVQTDDCMVARDCFNYASLIYKTVVLPEEIRNKIMKEESGIDGIAYDITVKYSKSQLKAIFNKVNQYSTELFDYLLQKTKQAKTKAKLFAKIIK